MRKNERRKETFFLPAKKWRGKSRKITIWQNTVIDVDSMVLKLVGKV